MTENEERYLWLRDNRSRYHDAPYVLNQRKSVLYAMARLRDEELDVALDHDIFDNKLQELHDANEIVERGLLPEGASRWDFEGPYVEALIKLTHQELGWSDERVARIMPDERYGV